MAFYLNGVAVTPTSFTAASSTPPILTQQPTGKTLTFLGDASSFSHFSAQGQFDELAFVAKSLSTTAVAEIYNQPKPYN